MAKSMDYLAKTALVAQVLGILELMVLGFLVILAHEWYDMIYPGK